MIVDLPYHSYRRLYIAYTHCFQRYIILLPLLIVWQHHSTSNMVMCLHRCSSFSRSHAFTLFFTGYFLYIVAICENDDKALFFGDGYFSGPVVLAFLAQLFQSNILIVGTRAVYVCGQLVYTVGMIALASTNHVVVVFLGSITTGFMYTTLFTLPYILVSRYHSNTEVILFFAPGERTSKFKKLFRMHSLDNTNSLINV